MYLLIATAMKMKNEKLLFVDGKVHLENDFTSYSNWVVFLGGRIVEGAGDHCPWKQLSWAALVLWEWFDPGLFGAGFV